MIFCGEGLQREKTNKATKHKILEMPVIQCRCPVMPLSERGNRYDGVFFFNLVELHCLCNICVYSLGSWLRGA